MPNLFNIYLYCYYLCRIQSMKIIHIHPSLAMASKFILPLIDYEKYVGYQSQLIVFKSDKVNQSHLCFDLRINNFNLLIEIFKFMIFLRKYQPDIIFCHNSTQATIPLFCSKLLKIQTIIYFNHGVPYLGYKGVLRKILYLIEFLNSSLSHKTITVSPDMKKYLDSIKPNTYIIHHGSACGILLPDNSSQKQLHKRKTFVVTFVGRLKIRKGIKQLTEILNFFEKNKMIKFIFCGFTNEEFYKFTKRKFKNLKCLGFIDNVNEILAESDIFLLPSYHEGLPYSILEAMMNRNFIIANNIPGINNIVINNYNGVLVDNNNPKKFISVISDFMDSSLDYHKYINNSLKTLQKYDRNKFLKEYHKFILNL